MFGSVCAELLGSVGGLDAFDGGQLNELMAGLVEVESMVVAVRAAAFGVWESSLGWSVDGSSSPTAWLKRNTGVRGGSAGRQVKQARFLVKHQEVAVPLARAEITVDHVALLARLDVPRLAVRFAADLELLLGFAVELGADEFAMVCQQWLALADQDHDPDHKGFEQRSLFLSQLLDGSWKLDAVLEAETGAVLSELIERLAVQHADRERAAVAADPGLVFDTTPTQRRADAFADIVSAALAADVKQRRRPRVSLNVIIDDDLLGIGAGVTDNGALIPPATMFRFLCDADLHAMVLDPNDPTKIVSLDLGRTARLASPEQRRALAARDRGCRFPGCGRGVAWTIAHHIRWWEHGGTTDISNLVLLCHHHHHLVHEGGWTISTDGHEFRFRSPNGAIDLRSHRQRRRTKHPEQHTDEHLGTRTQRQTARTTRAQHHPHSDRPEPAEPGDQPDPADHHPRIDRK